MKTGPIIGITTGVIAGTLLLGTGAFAAGVALSEPITEQRTEQRMDHRGHPGEHASDRDRLGERRDSVAEGIDPRSGHGADRGNGRVTNQRPAGPGSGKSASECEEQHDVSASRGDDRGEGGLARGKHSMGGVA